MDDGSKCSCPFRDWEAAPWAVVLFVAVVILSMYLGGNGG